MMKKLKHARAAALSISAFTALVLLAACSPVSTASYQEPNSSKSCGSLLSSVIERDRAGDTSEAIDSEMDMLGASCPTEYQIAVDYSSEKAIVPAVGPNSCEWLRQHLRPEAIELLREDRLCTAGAGAGSLDESWPEGGLGWNEAQAYVGSYQRVCGPLGSVRSTEDGIFINVGRDYPSPDRFTFIVWGDWYLDPIAADAVVCASGNIYLYKGVSQMELSRPDELEVWR